jgi:hypothetical protein
MANWSSYASWLLPLVVQAVLLGRLLFLGLAGRYHALAALQVASLIQGFVLFSLRDSPSQYFRAYSNLSAVLWLFFYWVLFELYRNVLKDYRGIAALSRWLITASACVSLAAVLFPVIPDLAEGVIFIGFRSLGAFLLAQKTVLISVSLFLACLMLLLVRFHIRLSPNTVTYCLTYTVLFGAKALTLVAQENLKADIRTTVTTANMLISAVCQLSPAFLLVRESTTAAAARLGWDEQRNDALQLQLAGLNESVYRLVRKA